MNFDLRQVAAAVKIEKAVRRGAELKVDVHRKLQLFGILTF